MGGMNSPREEVQIVCENKVWSVIHKETYPGNSSKQQSWLKSGDFPSFFFFFFSFSFFFFFFKGGKHHYIAPFQTLVKKDSDADGYTTGAVHYKTPARRNSF